MNTRIKYKKTDTKGMTGSRQTFKSSNGATYRIVIDTINITFRIVNTNENRTIKSGGQNINSIRVLKRAAKKALKGLGVHFNLELREIK